MNSIWVGMALLFLSVQSHANPLGILFSRKDARARLEIEHQSDTYHLNEKKESGDKRFTTYEGKFNLNFYKGGATTWFFSAASEGVDLGRETVAVGDSKIEVGGELKDQSFGLGFRHDFIDDSLIVTSVDYGSASDNPFAEQRNATVSVTFAYAFTPGIMSQWILFLNYSNNRSFLNNVPLPALAYVYRPAKAFSLTLGIPFVFMNYIDFPRRSFNLFLSPGAAGYDVAFGVVGPLQVFNGFAYKVRTYMHENRSEDDTRFFLEEKTVELGLRSPVIRGLFLSVSGGLSFDRHYYEGNGLFEELGERDRLPNDIYLKTKATVNF